MRENINKVSQRGERLDSLQDKTDNLAVSAQGFRRGANRVRKQMWWKDMKMRMCLIVGIIILLIIIIVPSGPYTPRHQQKSTQILTLWLQSLLRSTTLEDTKNCDQYESQPDCGSKGAGPGGDSRSPRHLDLPHLNLAQLNRPTAYNFVYLRESIDMANGRV